MGYVTSKVVRCCQKKLDLLTKGSSKGAKEKKDEKVKSETKETPQMQTTTERCLRPIMRWFHAPASADPTNIDSKTE